MIFNYHCNASGLITIIEAEVELSNHPTHLDGCIRPRPQMSIFNFVVAMTIMVAVYGFQTPIATTKRMTQQLSMAAEQDPLLLRAARGEVVESVPVWMMRQAGRHIKVSQTKKLCFSSFNKTQNPSYIQSHVIRNIETCAKCTKLSENAVRMLMLQLK